jgi:hypothetical protein
MNDCIDCRFSSAQSLIEFFHRHTIRLKVFKQKKILVYFNHHPYLTDLKIISYVDAQTHKRTNARSPVDALVCISQ